MYIFLDLEEKMKNYKDFYKLINQVGLNKKDFDDFLKNPNKNNKHLSYSVGPPFYPGTKYGTISVNDF
jgi:hypothetical protein